MKTKLNKLDTVLIISLTIGYFLYCAINEIIPSFEMVLKIGSFSILVIAGFIFILIPFYPDLNDWLSNNPKTLAIVGLLILTLVIQFICESYFLEVLPKI